jgi:hypothetical protein
LSHEAELRRQWTNAAKAWAAGTLPESARGNGMVLSSLFTMNVLGSKASMLTVEDEAARLMK